MAAKAQKPVKSDKAAAPEGWTPSMSDEAVKAKTGRGWMGWFIILNRANANAMPHQEVASLLHTKYDVPGWWAQMITVEYERARGGRKKHETPNGFSVSMSKTVNVPLAELYAATVNDKMRARWFPTGAFAVSSRTKDKYFRGPWGKNGARLEIGFYAKGEGKSQITVQVNKMTKEADVERERAAWKKAMEKLQTVLKP